MEFFENLSMRYNALTRQNKKLADFVRENAEAVIKMTAKSLGEASGTSAAAVVRLCRQLGYDGFEQMKITIARSVNTEDLNTEIDQIIAAGDSAADVAQKLYYTHSKALQDTLSMMDYESVKKAALGMAKARRVYLFGIGSSGLAAQELCHRLNRVGKTCIFLSDGHTNLEYACLAEKGDLAICFSYSGETKEVYLAAEQMRKNGVPVVAITRDRPSRLSGCATICVNIPETERRVRVGAFSSVMAQMFIINVLYMCMIQKDFEQYESKLMSTAHIANKLRE